MANLKQRVRHKILSVTQHPDKTTQVLVQNYVERINHYAPCILTDCKLKKKADDRDKQMKQEAEWLTENMAPDDTVILLDETGKSYTSLELANLIQRLQNAATRQCISIIGGAYGVSPDIKKRANYCVALSAFTLPHQLARLIWVEQLYRAYTILHNEKYHHI